MYRGPDVPVRSGRKESRSRYRPVGGVAIFRRRRRQDRQVEQVDLAAPDCGDAAADDGPGVRLLTDQLLDLNEARQPSFESTNLDGVARGQVAECERLEPQVTLVFQSRTGVKRRGEPYQPHGLSRRRDAVHDGEHVCVVLELEGDFRGGNPAPRIDASFDLNARIQQKVLARAIHEPRGRADADELTVHRKAAAREPGRDDPFQAGALARVATEFRLLNLDGLRMHYSRNCSRTFDLDEHTIGQAGVDDHRARVVDAKPIDQEPKVPAFRPDTVPTTRSSIASSRWTRVAINWPDEFR